MATPHRVPVLARSVEDLFPRLHVFAHIRIVGYYQPVHRSLDLEEGIVDMPKS
jgi:hypothetical protein